MKIEINFEDEHGARDIVYYIYIYIYLYRESGFASMNTRHNKRDVTPVARACPTPSIPPPGAFFSRAVTTATTDSASGFTQTRPSGRYTVIVRD